VPCGTAPTTAELLANHLECGREAAANGCTLVGSEIEIERRPTGECVAVPVCIEVCPPGEDDGGGTVPEDTEPTGPVNPEPEGPIA
jgi:hypothetical protein